MPVRPEPKVFDMAYQIVTQLSDDFHAQRQYYVSHGYQESEVRKDFIDKMFLALGWDVNHELQKNPYAQEVKVERPVTTGGSQRRADYAFYLAPNYQDVQFYVEAKKPSGDLVNPDNCFQVIRYGWNSDTPIAVLTDFDRFQIVDCRYKPNIKVAVSQALAVYTYLDYKDAESFAKMELTRFSGHLMVRYGGVRDGNQECQVYAGV
jgi:adenine-specific DNA-methyltransferase